jgi:hypothetical protein
MNLARTQSKLEDALAKKLALDREIGVLWEELRMLRIAAIRGGNDPGELPQLLGLDDMKRAGQVKTETRERANHAIDVSPEHQAGLRQIADLNSAA